MNAPKVLLADDDLQALRETGMFLKRNGFAVIPVEDGYSAVDQAVRHEPDVLVLDVHMPAGDGFSVHERIMHRPELTLCPVIYMTHDRSGEVHAMAEAHGAEALLYKPLVHDDLLAAVRDACAMLESDEAA